MRRRTLFTALAAACVLASGCVSTTDVQTIDTKVSELQRQAMQLETQAVTKAELNDVQTTLSAQSQNLLKAQADARADLVSLASQVEELKGKLESTNLRLGEVSQQLAATLQELRARPLAPPEDAAAAAPAPPADDPKALYEAAYNDYLRGNYETALQAFQEYLATFPDTDLADNAVYWIGESHYRQRRYRQAIEQFDRVIQRYPKSDKVASAWLKRGYSHLELGERQQGVLNLRHVAREFPAGDEANLARQRLREMGVDAR